MLRVPALILALFVWSAASAQAQPTPQPGPIGRVAARSGAVSYHASAEAPAADALVNHPLTTGSRLVTPPRAHATIEIAAGRFDLDGDSAITVGTLAPAGATIILEQGALFLHVLPGGAGQVFRIETPRGTLRVDQPGAFEVEIARSGTVTASAWEGGAQFDETTVLSPGIRATMAKDAPPLLEPAVEDDFIRRIAAEVEASGENQLEPPSHVSPQITGFSELQRQGLWIATEQYGWVWEPQVMSDWAPFQHGRWAEIAPFGRTWIDDAAWGFAPAHYGSWAKVNQRWVWLPGDAAVADVRVNGTQAQSAAAPVRWVPLGPEEPVSAAAPVIINNVRVINQPTVPKVVNVTTINNTTNVTNVVKEERRPSLVVITGHAPFPPPSPPPSPPPVFSNPGRNVTGLGAAGTPMGRGVVFPGQR